MKKIFYYSLILFITLLSSCERDNFLENSQAVIAKSSFKVKTVRLSEIPQVRDFIQKKINPTLFEKSTEIDGAIFDNDNILEVIDTLNQTNYTFRFTYLDAPIGTFYNLIVGKTADGVNITPYVLKYVCDDTQLETLIANNFDFRFFKGKVGIYKYTDFFALGSFSKGGINCPENTDENGDPIPCDTINTDGSGTSGGSGDSSTDNPSGDGTTGGGSGSSSCSLHFETQYERCNSFYGDGLWCEIVVAVWECHDLKSFSPKDGEDCPDCPNPSGGVGVLTEGPSAEFFFDNNLIDPEWIDEIGTYLGRPSLKYFQKVIYPNGDQAYNLDLGAILYVSQTKRFISGHDASNSIIASTEDSGPFYYMTTSGDWFEVSLDDFQTDCLSCDIEYLFAKVEIAALKFTGRYIIPVEDFIILFDGTDFDGVEANRYLAGGMLLFSIVPGSKIIKAVKLIPGNAMAWIKIVNIGNQGIKLPYTLVNGIVDFGSRNSTKFRRMVGLVTGDPRQAHHIIPWGKRLNDLVQKAARAGKTFHINEALNAVPVEAWRNQPNHNIYDQNVQNLLDTLPDNLTPNEAYDEILSIIDTIRNTIINNPDVHLNDLIF